MLGLGFPRALTQNMASSPAVGTYFCLLAWKLHLYLLSALGWGETLGLSPPVVVYWGDSGGGGSSSEGLGHWDRKGSSRGLGETWGGTHPRVRRPAEASPPTPGRSRQQRCLKLKNFVELEKFLLTTSSVPTGERGQNGLQAELSLGPFLEGTVEHFRSVRTGNALAKKRGP